MDVFILPAIRQLADSTPRHCIPQELNYNTGFPPAGGLHIKNNHKSSQKGVVIPSKEGIQYLILFWLPSPSLVTYNFLLES